MRKQHGIRRWLLGSLLVLAAAWAVLASGHGVSAEATKYPDHGSKEEFRKACEVVGGEFTEDSHGTSCYIPDVNLVLCDANGKDCWIHSPTAGSQPGGANSPAGTGEQNAPDDGGTGFPSQPGEAPPDTLPNLPGADD
jgi:hypothetical protein